MKTKHFTLALLCAFTFSLTSCKDLDKDAKEAAHAYCERVKLEKSLIKSETNRKAISAYLKKMNTIRKRYIGKPDGKKFDEAFERYKAECR